MAHERGIIVDQNDEVIGSKERNEVTRDDIYRVTGLWIENDKGEALLAQRSFLKKNDPGKWGPAVSGTVEVGETYDSNIVKEAREELGIVDHELMKAEKIRVRGEHNYFAQWYFCVLNWDVDKFVPEKLEVENLKWFGKKELADALEVNPEIFVEGLKQNSKLLNAFISIKRI